MGTKNNHGAKKRGLDNRLFSNMRFLCKTKLLIAMFSQAALIMGSVGFGQTLSWSQNSPIKIASWSVEVFTLLERAHQDHSDNTPQPTTCAFLVKLPLLRLIQAYPGLSWLILIHNKGKPT